MQIYVFSEIITVWCCLRREPAFIPVDEFGGPGVVPFILFFFSSTKVPIEISVHYGGMDNYLTFIPDSAVKMLDGTPPLSATRP